MVLEQWLVLCFGGERRGGVGERLIVQHGRGRVGDPIGAGSGCVEGHTDAEFLAAVGVVGLVGSERECNDRNTQGQGVHEGS